MIKSYDTKIRINKPLRGLPVGCEKKIKVDKNGIPLERYWRDRFADTKIDDCISVLEGE